MSDQLPSLPVPAPPKNPPCAWCGERPAKSYEVEPPIMTTRVVKGARVRVVKKRAITAYVCQRHRALFDRQKAEKKAGKAA